MPRKARRPSWAEQIRESVERSGLSLRELSRRSGVTHVQLSRFMRGQRSLTIRAAEKVGAALGLRLVQGD